MIQKTFPFFIICFLLLTADCIIAQNKKNTPKSSGKNIAVFKSPFRYVIISVVSELEKYKNENPDAASFEVLMEDRAFNETNLKILYKLLDERFTEKSGFYAWVYTSLDAVRTPEENEHINLKGPVENYFDYKWAFFARNGNGKWIDYSIPDSVSKRIIIEEAKKGAGNFQN